jgi:hypothetical protein
MDVAKVILITGGCLGLVCSMLTLWIIYRMNRINGYLKLIIALTVSQLCYDFSIVLVLFNWSPIVFLYIAIRSMSGLWATFVTNILSFVVLYTVWTSSVIDLAKNIRYILPTFFIPATLYGIIAPYVIFYSSDSVAHIVTSIYYWIRVASIIFNICSYLAMVYKLNQIDSLSCFSSQSSTLPSRLKVAQSPLWALAHRLKYYPIVQIITRLPVAIHEYSFGHDYNYPTDGSLRAKLSLLAYVLFLPAAGLGFFLVFITVCPGAAQQLKFDLNSILCFFSSEELTKPAFDGNQRQQEVISQLFSSRFSDDQNTVDGSPNISPSFLELSQHILRESCVSDDELRYSIDIPKSSLTRRTTTTGRFNEYLHWNEDDLIAEIGRLYSVDPGR